MFLNAGKETPEDWCKCQGGERNRYRRKNDPKQESVPLP